MKLSLITAALATTTLAQTCIDVPARALLRGSEGPNGLKVLGLPSFTIKCVRTPSAAAKAAFSHPRVCKASECVPDRFSDKVNADDMVMLVDRDCPTLLVQAPQGVTMKTGSRMIVVARGKKEGVTYAINAKTDTAGEEEDFDIPQVKNRPIRTGIAFQVPVKEFTLTHTGGKGTPKVSYVVSQMKICTEGDAGLGGEEVLPELEDPDITIPDVLKDAVNGAGTSEEPVIPDALLDAVNEAKTDEGPVIPDALLDAVNNANNGDEVTQEAEPATTTSAKKTKAKAKAKAKAKKNKKGKK